MVVMAEMTLATQDELINTLEEPCRAAAEVIAHF